MYESDVCYFVIVDNKVSDNIIFDNCNCFATNGDLGFILFLMLILFDFVIQTLVLIVS